MTYESPVKAERQKTLAALLAAGVSEAEAAKLVGVSVAYVKVLLKGDLFHREIDEQRTRLVAERLGEYTKLASEQLLPNLQALITLRDDPKSKPSDRLRAIEMINDALVPRAKPTKGPTAEVRATVVLTPQETAVAEAAISESERVRRQ